MKSTPFWPIVALLLSAPSCLAQTTTSSTASCTASKIATLCDYPSSGPYSAAVDSRASCWEYCNAHQPCSFAIFLPGNPHTGSGTCWTYPGESYDPSKGSTTGCPSPYLEVYDKPVCSGATTTAPGACPATNTPSAVAQVCGYPMPPDNCWSTCAASSGAVHCLDMCVTRGSCNYAVFNPHNSANSPYYSGTCWMYYNGTYDAGSAKTCNGPAEQYVYNNPCPKQPPPQAAPTTPLPSSGSSSSSQTGGSSTSSSNTGTGAGSTSSNAVATSSGSGSSGAGASTGSSSSTTASGAQGSVPAGSASASGTATTSSGSGPGSGTSSGSGSSSAGPASSTTMAGTQGSGGSADYNASAGFTTRTSNSGSSPAGSASSAGSSSRATTTSTATTAASNSTKSSVGVNTNSASNAFALINPLLIGSAWIIWLGL